MIKKNLGKIIISSIIILLPILAGVLLWDRLPEQIPTHFGPNGTADGWSSKTFAVYFMPFIILAMHFACVFATMLDPKHKNITGKSFGIVLWVCPALSTLMSVIMYLTALEYMVNVTTVMMLFIGALYFIIGNYLPKCRQNYTIGIKVPWTLNDEGNWNATHRFAGGLWVVCGLVLIACAFFKFAWIVFVCTISVMVLAPIVYSFWYYKKK